MCVEYADYLIAYSLIQYQVDNPEWTDLHIQLAVSDTASPTLSHIRLGRCSPSLACWEVEMALPLGFPVTFLSVSLTGGQDICSVFDP